MKIILTTALESFAPQPCKVVLVEAHPTPPTKPPITTFMVPIKSDVCAEHGSNQKEDAFGLTLDLSTYLPPGQGMTGCEV